MSILRKIKNNRFVRGVAYLYMHYFGVQRSKLGYCGYDVRLTPPYA